VATALEVDVTADATNLRAQLALAEASARSLGAQVRSMAAEMQRSGQSDPSPALNRMAEASGKAKQQVMELQAQIAKKPEGEEGLLGVFDALKGRFASVTALGGEVREFGEALMAAFAVERISEFVEHIAEAGAKVEHLSQQLGVPAEQISTFGFMARQMGLDVDQAAGILEKLERSMVKAAGGAGTQAKAFADLGISTAQINAHMGDAAGMLGLVADAFNRSADGPAKTAIAMEIAGHSAAEMIPLLDQGSAGMAAMSEQAKATGSNISGPMAEGMEQTVQGISTLKDSFEGIAITLFEAFKPAIDATVSGITDLVQGFNDALKADGLLHDVLTAMVVVVDGVINGFALFRLAIEELYDVVKGNFRGMMDDAAALGGVMYDVFTGRWGSISHDFKISLLQMQTDNSTTLANMATDMETYLNTVKRLTSNLGAHGVDTSGGKEEAPEAKPKLNASNLEETQHSADEQLEIWKNLDSELGEMDRADLDTDLAISRSRLEAKEQMLDAEVAAGKITAEQKVTLERGLNEQLYQLDLARLKQEVDLNSEDLVEQDRINNAILKLQAQHALDMEKLNRDMNVAIAEDQKKATKDWDTLLQPMGQTFAKTMSGMIEGTATLAGAFRSMLDSMLTHTIEWGIKTLVHWVSIELAKTSATAAGTAARVTTQAAGAAAGKAVDAAAGSASVVGDAHKAFAGAYSAVVGIPIIGPVLAPIAGATAFAAVTAMDVFSAEGGFGNVPYDDAPAMLHREEMVLPADIANPFREMLSGGGNTSNYGGNFSPTVHVHGANGKAPTTRDIIRELRNAHRNGEFERAA
jgi:hypothetical protein